jgi:hypothetical protein
MSILLQALIGSLIIVVFLGIWRLWRIGRGGVIRWSLVIFIFNYLLCLFIVYFFMPAYTGPFWGWQWLFWPLLISSLVSLGIDRVYTGDTSRAATSAIMGLGAAVLLGIIVPILIIVFTTWFDSNAKALAALPRVKVDNGAVLPPTDPKHVVLVSQDIAAYKGQQVLGSTGGNLGSSYSIDPAQYKLQSINNHLYFVAGLSYNNIFVNLSHSSTPGFVVIDAEDPEKPALLYTGDKYSLAVLPGALFNQDLHRHVYLNGYTDDRLGEPALELNDEFRPYWTIPLTQPTRGYIGDVLSGILVVDAHTGAIQRYQVKDVPAWVDRVMPAQLVKDYLEWWGLYHDAPWFNLAGTGQQKMASDPSLLYSDTNRSVWMVPMTSSSSNDRSCTGIFLYDTHDNQATFYPKAAGIGIGDNVTKTFESVRANIRGYDVDKIQLYQIYGVPTWLALYVRKTDTGSIYQAVGVVDARQLNGSNVQFREDLATVLRDYQQWLVHNGTDKDNSSETPKEQTFTGTVERISQVLQSDTPIFYIKLKELSVIFTTNLTLSPELPLTQVGDRVTIKFIPVEDQVLPLTAFDNLDIKLETLPLPTKTPPISPTPALAAFWRVETKPAPL